MLTKKETMEKFKIVTDLFKTPENLAILNSGKGSIRSISEISATGPMIDELIKIIRSNVVEDISGQVLGLMDARVERIPVVYKDNTGYYFNGDKLGRTIQYNTCTETISRNIEQVTVSTTYPGHKSFISQRIKLDSNGYPIKVKGLIKEFTEYEYEMHPDFNLPIKVTRKQKGEDGIVMEFTVHDDDEWFAYRRVHVEYGDLPGYNILTIKKKIGSNEDTI